MDIKCGGKINPVVGNDVLPARNKEAVRSTYRLLHCSLCGSSAKNYLSTPLHLTSLTKLKTPSASTAASPDIEPAGGQERVCVRLYMYHNFLRKGYEPGCNRLSSHTENSSSVLGIDLLPLPLLSSSIPYLCS